LKSPEPLFEKDKPKRMLAKKITTDFFENSTHNESQEIFDHQFDFVHGRVLFRVLCFDKMKALTCLVQLYQFKKLIGSTTQADEAPKVNRITVPEVQKDSLVEN
jgi:hypothetical protein